MYNPIEQEIWHQQHEELAGRISQERLARSLRPARPHRRPLKALAGRLAARGKPQAAR
jgi:hypothetical protein